MNHTEVHGICNFQIIAAANMSYETKGCMREIVELTRVPSTSPNKKKNGGGTVIVKLSCGHILKKRASSLIRPGNPPKKCQCWECVAEAIKS